MIDPLTRLRVSNRLLEGQLKSTAGVLELCANHMRLALEGGADPNEVLLHCSRQLDGERQHIISDIEQIRAWVEK